jgi:hypothetical protein
MFWYFYGFYRRQPRQAQVLDAGTEMVVKQAQRIPHHRIQCNFPLQ